MNRRIRTAATAAACVVALAFAAPVWAQVSTGRIDVFGLSPDGGRIAYVMTQDVDGEQTIVRESDGLAMSSRNRYLTPDERRRAPVLSATRKRDSCWITSLPPAPERAARSSFSMATTWVTASASRSTG